MVMVTKGDLLAILAGSSAMHKAAYLDFVAKGEPGWDLWIKRAGAYLGAGDCGGV